ncbi:MAG: hypothetical protein LLG14_24945 [Nocardiaceae bacterium]|nr:hypothetical protein [Nocardiaceae bacterium]
MKNKSEVQKLIERSSLGSKSARDARASVPAATGRRIVRQAETGQRSTSTAKKFQG